MEINTEYQDFIKSRALKDYSSRRIKKELDEFFSQTHKDVPCKSSVEIYTARFKAAARGHVFNPKTSINLIDEKYRTFIENGVNQGKRAAQIEKELWKKYGRNSVSHTTIYVWVARFKAIPEKAKSSQNQSSSSDSVHKYRSFIQNDKTKQDFIKRRVLRGLHYTRIKKDLDRVYGPNAHSLETVRIWASRFSAVAPRSVYASYSHSSRFIDVKYRKLIEKGVHQRKRLHQIEKEIWGKYGKKSVSRTSINYWFHRFKDVEDEETKSSNHQSSSETSSSDNAVLKSHPDGQAIVPHESCTNVEISNEDQSLLPTVANTSTAIQIDNKQNNSDGKTNLEREVNVCGIEKSEKNSNWYKFKWTNQDFINRLPSKCVKQRDPYVCLEFSSDDDDEDCDD